MGQFGTFFVEIILKLLHNCIAIADMSKKKQNKTSEVGESLLDLGLAWSSLRAMLRGTRGRWTLR